MQHMGAKEAADAIRSVIILDRSMREDPANVHKLRFVKEVCRELGLEETPENVTHVGTVLREQGIALHGKGKNTPSTSRASGTAPRISCIPNRKSRTRSTKTRRRPTRNSRPRVSDGATPVQDLSVDLKNQVPQTLRPGEQAHTDPLPYPDLAEATTAAAKVQGGFDLDHAQDDPADDGGRCHHSRGRRRGPGCC